MTSSPSINFHLLPGKRWTAHNDAILSRVAAKHPEVLDHLPQEPGLSFAVVPAERVGSSWHFVVDDYELREAALLALEQLAEQGYPKTRDSSPGSKLVVCSIW